MRCWDLASVAEKKQFIAISAITAHRSYLMDFLFDKHNPKLSESPDLLLKKALSFPSHDYLLVKLCLNIWCEQGKFEVHELFNLDYDVFIVVLNALAELGS